MLINLSSSSAKDALSADLCIIGGGPAGMCIASEYLGRGESVALLETGSLEADAGAQMLSLGRARGAIARNYPFYLSSSRLRLLGGSQLAWGGWCTPLTGIDFAYRDWVPHSGWPFAPEELTPYYKRTAKVCGLHESTARPIEEQPVLGGELTERLYYFAPARRTARDVFLPALTEAGNVTLCLGASVTELECNSARTRLQTVRARSLDGASISVRAKNFVLAAGGIENARLLLINEIGNRYDLAGRYFMEHPHVLLGSAVLPAKEKWHRYMERTDKSLGHTAMFALGLSADGQRSHRLLNATVQIWPEPEGDDIGGDMIRAKLILRAEQRPNRNSRIRIGEEVDPLGLPTAQLDWELENEDWASVCATARLVAAALTRHAGAQVELAISEDAPWPPFPINGDRYHPWGCHHMGTTRMSTDPRSGVVDTNARVHGMENLFVAGSSVFPTGGFANPTFTLMALAFRTADHLKTLS